MRIETLCRKLGYDFKDAALIKEALRHSSFVNELGEPEIRDNERLEFLGDAVLNLIIGHLLMAAFPTFNEGDLSRMRATLVNESQLARVARTIDLGAYIQLGKGEMQSSGNEKSSILADTLEAVIAAVYLDGGLQAARRVVEDHFAHSLESVGTSDANRDFKSQLQELAQVTFHATPIYQIIAESGPDHDKTFTVQLKVQDIVSEGVGKSKKLAEQDAARRALDILLV
jgi:ribonuclease-3